MPSTQSLRDAGRADLLRAIREHGGAVRVAARLGAAVRKGGLGSPGHVLGQLQQFVQQNSALLQSTVNLTAEPLKARVTDMPRAPAWLPEEPRRGLNGFNGSSGLNGSNGSIGSDAQNGAGRPGGFSLVLSSELQMRLDELRRCLTTLNPFVVLLPCLSRS